MSIWDYYRLTPIQRWCIALLDCYMGIGELHRQYTKGAGEWLQSPVTRLKKKQGKKTNSENNYTTSHVPTAKTPWTTKTLTSRITTPKHHQNKPFSWCIGCVRIVVLKSDYFRIEIPDTYLAMLQSWQLKSDYFRIEILLSFFIESMHKALKSDYFRIEMT